MLTGHEKLCTAGFTTNWSVCIKLQFAEQVDDFPCVAGVTAGIHYKVDFLVIFKT